MAFSKTSIVSLAAMLMGHKPIQTLENADDLITALSQAFDILLPSVLSTGNWRFAVQIQQLSLSTEVPPTYTNWQNIYYLPPGYLKNIRIIPNNYVYEIYSNSLIYCNWGTQSPVFMEYAYMPLINTIPAVFINYFIYELSAFASLNNAQKPEFYQVLEAKRILQLAVAAGSDAMNRPQYSQANIPALNNRNITGVISQVIIG